MMHGTYSVILKHFTVDYTNLYKRLTVVWLALRYAVNSRNSIKKANVTNYVYRRYRNASAPSDRARLRVATDRHEHNAP